MQSAARPPRPMDELSEHFRIARGSVRRRRDVAARELRVAAARLSLAAGRAQEPAREPLLGCARDLERTAQAIEAGRLPSQRALDDLFLQARLAQVRSDYLNLALAYRALYQTDPLDAARGFRRAIRRVAGSVNWLGYELGVPADPLLGEVEALAEQLEVQEASDAAELQERIDALGRALDRLSVLVADFLRQPRSSHT
jgi:hypothetical protein